MAGKGYRLSVNSPVILGMSFLSLLVLIWNAVFPGFNSITAIYYTSWADPLMYMRLFTHVLTHFDLAHYANNFLLILAVGPLVEEKYGSGKLVLMICITALVTGLVNVLFFKQIMLMGASGIVFMLILLASYANIKEGKIPLTVILVGVLYIGNEIMAGLFTADNISRLSHILGGFCGAGFGLVHNWDQMRRKSIQ